jgi:hypothetical protein
MLIETCIFFFSLAGFFTVCLTKAAALNAPKPFMAAVEGDTNIAAINRRETTAIDKTLWQHSSGAAFGVSWDSTSVSPVNCRQRFVSQSTSFARRRPVRQFGSTAMMQPDSSRQIKRTEDSVKNIDAIFPRS